MTLCTADYNIKLMWVYLQATDNSHFFRATFDGNITLREQFKASPHQHSYDSVSRRDIFQIKNILFYFHMYT